MAADIACGTGQSTLPLLEIARRVVGLDVSAAMLREATRDERIDYVVARAERLPLASGSVDLVTVALAFHWFDRDAFLSESARALRPGGGLTLYNNAFLGRMAGDDVFGRWFRESYLTRYPAPPRRGAPVTAERADAHGLEIVLDMEYANEVTFTPRTLAEYFVTQSNVIAVAESGRESMDEALARLHAEAQRVVPSGGGTFAFGGPVTCLRKRG